MKTYQTQYAFGGGLFYCLSGVWIPIVLYYQTDSLRKFGEGRDFEQKSTSFQNEPRCTTSTFLDSINFFFNLFLRSSSSELSAVAGSSTVSSVGEFGRELRIFLASMPEAALVSFSNCSWIFAAASSLVILVYRRGNRLKSSVGLLCGESCDL